MRRITALLVALVLASFAVSAMSGCGDSGGDEQATTQSEPAAGGESSEAAEEGREEGGSVPASLGTLESGAEDAVDQAHARDRAAVVRTARKVLQAARGRAGADLREAGVAPVEITALQDRARLLDGIAARASFARVALAANSISGLMPALYARFEDPVPPDVLKLDYLDREAQLRSQAGDRASVPPIVKGLAATWAKLRPDVIDAGGEAVAARYADHVRAMRRLARAAGRPLEREASNGLELVDELESQFRKQ